MTKRALLAIAVIMLVVAAPLARAAEWRVPKGKTWTWTFAADTLGQAPEGAQISGGRWIVLLDSTQARYAIPAMPESGAVATFDSAATPRILRQAEDEDGVVFHTLQFPKPRLRDLEVSVRFRIRSGEIDPSAGVAFQLDPKGRNGYVVRVSGQSQELTAHYLLYGKRRDIRYCKIDPPGSNTWHTIHVRRVGSVMEVTYDGKERFRIRDERFGEGNVGLWTEDDSIVDFADLTVRSL